MTKVPSSRRNLPRRYVLRWLAAAPAAAVAAREIAFAQAQGESGFDNLDELAEPKDKKEQEKAEKGLSDAARCIAENRKDLSRKEKQRLMEKMKPLEGALTKLRDFQVADDVEPALVFRAAVPAGRRS